MVFSFGPFRGTDAKDCVPPVHRITQIVRIYPLMEGGNPLPPPIRAKGKDHGPFLRSSPQSLLGRAGSAMLY